jgi:ketopantoate hydroxymethyltransferase
MKPISIISPNELKKAKIPAAGLTAYDSSFASVTKAGGIEVILVGDSLCVTQDLIKNGA